jgi:hypothetical protein
MKNGWGKTFNEKDYVKFINSVDGLTYSNENLMAITYSIYFHTNDVPKNFKTTVANELIKNGVVREVLEV